ncbi:CHAT domain-containing protein [Haliangium sp.]|uniref:CHAT domain-containing protein n=1 Tax=Haliangium sp. TaxID=2663208 RepID=UPI003D0DEF18
MTRLEEVPCLLILDLSVENTITERSLLPLLPDTAAEPLVYRVSDYGAERARRGNATDERTWRAWTQAVDAMLAAMWDDLDDDAELAHYYVAGRAGLPICAYLGLKLGKQARITALNARPDGEWDFTPFQRPRSTAAASATTGQASRESRFFTVVKGLRRDDPVQVNGKVAVFVSTQRELVRDDIADFAHARDIPLAGIVEIRAAPDPDAAQSRQWMDGSDGPRVAAELEQHLTTVAECYPHHEGLMVFIAGPLSLAVMVGRALNPHIFVPIYLPNYAGHGYASAVEVPWPLVSGGKPRFLITTACPATTKRLSTESELRDLSHLLDAEVEAGRCDVELCPAVRDRDLLDKLTAFKPHILHFGGHGKPRGVSFMRDDGSERFFRIDEMRTALTATGSDLLLVVLNACHSWALAEALDDLVDLSIGMSHEIPDAAARSFARRFYKALTQGVSVARALEQGKLCAEVSDGLIRVGGRKRAEAKKTVFFSPIDPAHPNR